MIMNNHDLYTSQAEGQGINSLGSGKNKQKIVNCFLNNPGKETPGKACKNKEDCYF